MHSRPRDLETYRRFFGSPVRFGWDFDGIVCKARDLEAPIPTADPVMARYLKQYLDSILPRADVKMSATVRELASATLSSGNCSAQRIAAHLGVDRRTVHRHLAREGETFSSIMDAVRTEIATRSIENRDHPLYAVAERLGFSGLSAFSRWFRNRFGCSVSAWRAANVGANERGKNPPAKPPASFLHSRA